MKRILFISIVLSLAPWVHASSEIRLAVVDFQPSGVVGEYETLGAGLQSMLTTDLSAVSTLTVVERAQLSALQRELKLSRSALADPKTALRIGKLAGASHLLTGSFTLVGNKMRLDARVIDVATAKVAFAAKIEGEKDAFFELEKDLAAKVIESVGVHPSAKERSVLGRVHTADLGAFQKFSQGLVLFDEQHYERAFEALKEASQKDEEFKLARATLEQYERLSAEMRAKAQLIDAQTAADSARVRQEELSTNQQIQQQLLAIADRASAPKRERAAALVLLSSMVDVSDDRFADARMHELFISRYMFEFSPLFPQFAITPLRPFGERYGPPDVPETPGRVSSAVSEAAAAITFQPPRPAENIREMRDESVSSNWKRVFPELVGLLPLDFKGQTNALQRLYELGAKNVQGDWRADAMALIARRRRGTLELTESTRLLREASNLSSDSNAVRNFAREVEENGKIAQELAQVGGNACLREALMLKLAVGNTWSRSRNDKNPCTARDLVSDRLLHDDSSIMVGDLKAWVVTVKQASVWSGPRPDALRTLELRYVAPSDAWSVIMLGGIPRAQAELQFSLGYEQTDDAPMAADMARGAGSDVPAEIPNVSVFFGARNVKARDRDGNEIPMRATGVTIGAGRVSLADVRAELYSREPEKLKITGSKASPIELSRKGLIPVKVTRESNRITVAIGGKQLQFDAPAVAPGFIGIAVEGRGFVRIVGPTISGWK